MPLDLSKLSDEQLDAYRTILERRQAAAHPPGVPAPPIPEELQNTPERQEGGGGNEPGLPAIVVNGVKQLARAIPAFASGTVPQKSTVSGPAVSRPEYAQSAPARGTADLIEGTGKIASPLALPAAIMNPIGTAAAIGGGTALGKGGEALAQHFGASPDVARLTGDITGTIGGGLTAKGATALGKTVAPALAESSLGIRGKQRQFGAEPGKGALRETSGFSPDTVSQSAADRIASIAPVLDRTTELAGPVDRGPALATVRDARALTARQGDLTGHGDLDPIEESLNRNRVTGEEYPNPMTARDALELRRGFGREQGHFDRQPGRTDIATRTARSAYGNLTDAIHEAAPGSVDLDKRIQDLTAVRDRGKVAGLGAGATERMVDRATRPTGGLLAPIFGFHTGGLPGALEAIGAQEGLSSPAVKMGLARGLWRGVGGERLGVPEMPQAPPVRGLIGSGPIITPAPEDTSFVRSAPAPPPFRTGFTQRALPAVSATVANPEIGSQHGDIIGQPQSPYRRPLTMREIQEQ